VPHRVALPLVRLLGHDAVLAAPAAERAGEPRVDPLLRKVAAPVVRQARVDHADVHALAVASDGAAGAEVGHVDGVERPVVRAVCEIGPGRADHVAAQLELDVRVRTRDAFHGADRGEVRLLGAQRDGTDLGQDVEHGPALSELDEGLVGRGVFQEHVDADRRFPCRGREDEGRGRAKEHGGGERGAVGCHGWDSTRSTRVSFHCQDAAS
jgi:hypothetical protein